MKNKFRSPIFFLLMILTVLVHSGYAAAECPRMTVSQDGTPISYEVFGQGEPALIFVHGWSCDGRYFREQIPALSKQHRVIVLDLAGHGHSGSDRGRFTMKSFGEDVKAVADATGSTKLILIGHSMGGVVIGEAARLMPDRVIGLIGVDTLENIEYPMTEAMVAEMTAPLRKDFKTGTRGFVQPMFHPDTDANLREWILSDMAAAPPAVAMSAMDDMMKQYITGDLARSFDTIRVPVITINGDLWPVDVAANRRHMMSFDAVVLKKADHFLMLASPVEFNLELEKAVQRLTNSPPKNN